MGYLYAIKLRLMYVVYQIIDFVRGTDFDRGYKQVLVIRKDLKVRRGKEIAQCAHASLKAVMENRFHPDVMRWSKGRFTKIAVSVDSEEELMNIYNQAKENGLVCSLILDAGFTEFDGVPTYTAVAVGPSTNEKVDAITGHLKLR